MKSEIFSEAINRRNRLSFMYGFEKFIIEPYYISTDKYGRKIIFGKVGNSNEIKKFEYSKIVNIRILNRSRFSPVIPIIPQAV